MHANAASVVGRDAELELVASFLGRRDELPRGLVIEGPAGAGKTTIWRAGVAAASATGYLVLSCRPAGAEVQLAHSALSDLLEPYLDTVLPSLPGPQRRAVEAALLLADEPDDAPDPRAVAAGILNAIRALARETPVLLAIDDAQWVDAASAQVLEFAMRRLADAPVAILASRRLTSATGTPAAAATTPGVRPELALERPIQRIQVGPLSLGAIHRMLRTQTTLDFNRRSLQRIHETSGGNPFYALELARAMEAAGGSEVEPLPLGTSLNDLLAERLHGLPEPTRAALFVAAALGQPSVEHVAGPIGLTVKALEVDLEAATRSGVISLDHGRVEFTHPLLAAAAYAEIDGADRRRWHARIAESATDSETRARHLALARPGADAELAQLLHAAARDALARGAPGAAADLFGQALDRLPVPARDADGAAAMARAELVAEAAPVIGASGQPDRAKGLLRATIAAIPAGPLRAELLLDLAFLVWDEPAAGDTELQLIDQALVEAHGDIRRTAMALLAGEQSERERDRSAAALPIARQALEASEASGDPLLLATAHVRTADLEIVLGLRDDPIARFQTALELGERTPVEVEHSASSMLAVCLIRAGRLDEARPYLLRELARSIAIGDEAGHSWVCLFLAELEWHAGRWDDLATYALEGAEVAEQAGMRMRSGTLRSLVGLAEASRGDPVRARTILTDAIATLEDVREVAYRNYARKMLAFLDLSLGDAQAAAAAIEFYDVGRAIEGSKRLSFVGDQIEAMVSLGDLDQAEALTAELEARATELHRPTMSAQAARCRALLLGAKTDFEAAIASAEEAVATYERLNIPFERARSLLVLGGIQRRAKQRKAARETLTAALEAFDSLGAHLWSAKANAERARIGGRSTIEGLSETELRVAKLVAEGRSNKEVAAALFVSVRAVESNLSKVYAKLGIESRTELARRF